MRWTLHVIVRAFKLYERRPRDVTRRVDSRALLSTRVLVQRLHVKFVQAIDGVVIRPRYPLLVERTRGLETSLAPPTQRNDTYLKLFGRVEIFSVSTVFESSFPVSEKVAT